MKKVNPRNIPRSQADVDKAFERGKEAGINGALVIMLYTLMDKYGASDDDLVDFGKNFNYTLDSINRGYVKERDLQKVIKTEYGVELKMDE